ncbi:MAG: DUF393 domain-containing protein [Deltaproteobacteria bacterium]|nr:DUF393 domain-containing protein [Deltaproteobacteria bacterium]
MDPGRHWIVWDGRCGFCRRAVAWALARDRDRRFEAVPYQELPDPPLTPALAAACRDAVHVRTTDGRWLRAGRACLFVLERVGWPRVARFAGLPPFVWAVEAGYRIVARNRPLFSRLLGRATPRAGR